jgi:hypothetical protein
MKKCSKCKDLKPFYCYNKRSKSIDGLRPDCKDCRKIESHQNRLKNLEKKKQYDLLYYQKNRTHIRSYHKEWYKNNSESVIAYQKEYRSNNADKIREYKRGYVNKKRNEDYLYKLKMNLRTRVRIAVKNKNWKISGISKILGAEILVVKKHLENQFKDGMNWDNYGKWHIDHIVPLSSAKTEEQMIKLCHYTNLQPLWALENIYKADKVR